MLGAAAKLVMPPSLEAESPPKLTSCLNASPQLPTNQSPFQANALTVPWLSLVQRKDFISQSSPASPLFLVQGASNLVVLPAVLERFVEPLPGVDCTVVE